MTVKLINSNLIRISSSEGMILIREGMKIDSCTVSVESDLSSFEERVVEKGRSLEDIEEEIYYEEAHINELKEDIERSIGRLQELYSQIERIK